MIVSYEHTIASSHSDLWPHIPYWWANKCKAEALIEAFEYRKQHGRPGNLQFGNKIDKLTLDFNHLFLVYFVF